MLYYLMKSEPTMQKLLHAKTPSPQPETAIISRVNVCFVGTRQTVHDVEMQTDVDVQK